MEQSRMAVKLVLDGQTFGYIGSVEDGVAWRERILEERPEAVVAVMLVPEEEMYAWARRDS